MNEKEYIKELQTGFDNTQERSWSEFRDTPDVAGIYAIKNNDKIVYIGETRSIHSRLTHHYNRNGSALKDKIEEHSGIDADTYLQNCTFKCFPVKLGRIELEEVLIKTYDPIFNNYKLRKRYKKQAV